MASPAVIDHAVATPSLGRSLLAVSRWEYMPGGVFFVFSSAALATGSWTALADELALVLWGTAVWYLSHLIGSQVNCLADAEVDLRDKSHLSRAVARLGAGRLVALLIIESALAISVSRHMASVSGREILPALWLAGLVLAIAYSVEPVRLKRRGWLNPLCLVAVLYLLPMAFGYVALAASARAAAIGVLVATGAQMLALIVLNPAEDVDSDRAAGLRTPCVVHGIGAVATLAALVFGAGTAGAGVCLALLASDHGVTAVAGVGAAVAAELVVLYEITRLAALIRGGEGRTPIVRRLVGRNPVHFAVLGVSLALAAASVCSSEAATAHHIQKGEIR